ncbi:hypothetical protein [Natronosalvus vescus]|uniref:hypothetical protein n=1 Tax=Natronosalvus vescus TaxID=2953881 RepID=UPI0020916EE9|nr:hypothetical protein [Natronosalvus vescus]
MSDCSMDDRSKRAGDTGRNAEQSRKVAATCTSCNAVYAAEAWPDGKVRPIGRREGCRCGETDFKVIETAESDSMPPRPDNS